MVAAYLLMALVGAGVAVFALQNLDPVVIRFLGWRIEGTPLALVIFVSIMAGMVLASAASLVQHVKLRARIRQLEQRLARAATAPEPPRDADTPASETSRWKPPSA